MSNTSGAAISTGQVDLDKIEARMLAMGARMLVKQPGNMTATEKSIDTAESISELQAMVRALERGLEEGFRLMGEWVKQPDITVNVKISEDFGADTTDSKDLDVLLKSRIANEIDRLTYLSELKTAGDFGRRNGCRRHCFETERRGW